MIGIRDLPALGETMKTQSKKRDKANSKAGSDVFTVGPNSAGSAPLETSEPEEQGSNGAMKPDRIQLSFDVNPDGSLNFSSMREKTKEKLRTVFSDPLLAEYLGTKPVSAQVNVINPVLVSGFYDVLGSVECSVFPMFFPKVPDHVWKRVFTYTQEEKAVLIPPTGRLLNKYCSEWFLKWQDEIQLAILLTTFTVAKVQAAVMLSRMNQPQPVTEMPEPEPPQSGPVQ